MGKMINGIWVDWIEKVKVLQKAVVMRSDGKILALKRPNDNHTRPACWDLPGGSIDAKDIKLWKEKSGRGDKNDILVKAIKREIFEEAGLKVLKTKAVHAASGLNEKKGVFIVGIGYFCTVKDDEIRLSPEHAKYKWVAKQEFVSFDVGDDGGFINAILNHI